MEDVGERLVEMSDIDPVKNLSHRRITGDGIKLVEFLDGRLVGTFLKGKQRGVFKRKHGKRCHQRVDHGVIRSILHSQIGNILEPTPQRVDESIGTKESARFQRRGVRWHCRKRDCEYTENRY